MFVVWTTSHLLWKLYFTFRLLFWQYEKILFLCFWLLEKAMSKIIIDLMRFFVPSFCHAWICQKRWSKTTFTIIPAPPPDVTIKQKALRILVLCDGFFFAFLQMYLLEGPVHARFHVRNAWMSAFYFVFYARLRPFGGAVFCTSRQTSTGFPFTFVQDES